MPPTTPLTLGPKPGVHNINPHSVDWSDKEYLDLLIIIIAYNQKEIWHHMDNVDGPQRRLIITMDDFWRITGDKFRSLGWRRSNDEVK